MLRSKISCDCGFTKIVHSEKYEHLSRIKCPNCSKTIVYRKNISFDQRDDYPYIRPDDFMHPLDRTALNAVRALRGIDWVTRKLLEHTTDKFKRVTEMVDDIKVTTQTCGYIHDMAVQASKVLGVSMPDVYINQNPVVGAYTTCVSEPMIVINSGLIELCDDDELFVTISHEMGHIKCEHVLYHMVADIVIDFPDILGVTKIITAGMSMALLEWVRKSELSADRAALIVTKNKEKVISLLMKIAGGSSKLMNMIDYDDFVSQHVQFDEFVENWGPKIMEKWATLFRTHPFPILRAAEIDRWDVSEINMRNDSEPSGLALMNDIRSLKRDIASLRGDIRPQ